MTRENDVGFSRGVSASECAALGLECEPGVCDDADASVAHGRADWKEKREIDNMFEVKLEETLENAQSEAQRKSWEQRLRDGMAEKQKKIRQKVNMLTQDECREIFEEGKYNSAKDDRDQSKAKKLYALLKKQKGKVQDKGKALKDKGKALKDNLKEKGNRAFSGTVKKMETPPPGGVQTAGTLPGIDDPHQPLNDDAQPAEPPASGPDEGDNLAHEQRLKREQTIMKDASGQNAQSKLREDQRSWKGRTFPFVFEKGFGAKLMDRCPHPDSSVPNPNSDLRSEPQF
eukprot:832318-Rhodomonas_salina.1